MLYCMQEGGRKSELMKGEAIGYIQIAVLGNLSFFQLCSFSFFLPKSSQ